MSTSALETFSTCEISDALIKIKVPHGGYIPDIQLMSSGSGTRICGPAYTVQMVLTSNTEAPKLSTHFVDMTPAGSVIVIDAPPQAKNAVWGGLMTAGAQSRGAVGVIISGRCRDVAEHRSARFPVFARGTSTLGQSPFTRPSQVGIPLILKPHIAPEVGGFPAVTVQPGDWMVGDEDGVVCVPRDLEPQVIELAISGKRTDELCLSDIRAGRGIQTAFAAHRGT